MKKLLASLILALAIPAFGYEFITATLTVTNGSQTNLDSLTINGNVRSGATNRTAGTWQTNASPAITATNIYSQLGGWPVAGVLVSMTSPTNLTLAGAALTASCTSNFASLSFATNTVGTNRYALMMPSWAYPTTLQASNASDLVTLLAKSTNFFGERAYLLTNFAGLTNNQTIGNKTLNNTTLLDARLRTGQIGFYDYDDTETWIPLSSPEINAARIVYFSTNYGTGGAFTATNRGLYFAYSSADAPAFVLTADYAAFNPAIHPVYGGEAYATNHYQIDTTELSPAILTVNNYLYYFHRNWATNHNSFTGTNWFARAIFTNMYAFDALLTNATLQNPAISNATLSGTLRLTSRAAATLANGANFAIPLGTNTMVDLSGATTIAYIYGFVAGVEDEVKEVRLSGAVTNYFANLSGDPTPENLIRTGTGGDVWSTNNPTYLGLRYKGSRWEIKWLR